MENDIDIKGGYIMHELIAQPKMLLVVIVYLLALVGTGAYFAKKAVVKKEGKEDFFLAGRGLGKIVAVGTILATYTGGGTVTGGGNSLAFNYGLTYI
jgi:SSS family solute:Na+ symporter